MVHHGTQKYASQFRDHGPSPMPGAFGRGDGRARTTLADALELAVRELSAARGAWAGEAVHCQMLFELPAALIRTTADRAAAVLCQRDYGRRDLLFLVLDSRRGAITLLQAGEVPETVIDFTRSYAGVLGMIARDSILGRAHVH